MLRRTILAIAWLLGATAAVAQGYPNRQPTMVIPFAAGGPTDVLGRILAERMSDLLGQKIIIENVGSANGIVGTARVATSNPDGYVFMLGTLSTHAQNKSLYKNISYDAETDFAPIALVAEVPMVLVVRKDMPVATFAEFVQYARANHTKMSAALNPGALVLKVALGVEIKHVAYRGSAPAMQDIQGGHLDYMAEILTTAYAQIEGGAVKALAVLGPERSPRIPNVPTAKEGGLDVHAYTWNGLFLPKGTPADIVARLNAAVRDTLATAGVRDRLLAMGASLPAPERLTPEYLSGFVKSETAKWAETFKASGATIQ